MRKFSRHPLLMGGAATAIGAGSWPKGASAATPEAPRSPIAFTNVKIFDGKSEKLIAGKRVVVERNRIKAVEDATQPIPDGMSR